MALKKGYLRKTGIPNFDQAARKVIRDYMDGKMNYFTPAPHAEGMIDETENMMMDQSEMMNFASVNNDSIMS